MIRRQMNFLNLEKEKRRGLEGKSEIELPSLFQQYETVSPNPPL